MIQNLVQHSKTKHIDIRHHFIKDMVQNGKVELFYITTSNQLVAIFTKALDEKTLNKLITDIGMGLMT